MFLDYSSAILLLLGYLIVGKDVKWGWLVSFIGNIGYIFVSIRVGLYGNLILAILMTIMSAYNFIKWHMKDVNKQRLTL